MVFKKSSPVTGDAAAGLLMGVLLSLVGCSHQTLGSGDNARDAKAEHVAVAKVVRANLSQAVRIAADFRPFQEIDVHAEVAGYVKRINVDVGDRVTKGETLAVLEVPQLEGELDQVAAAMRQSAQEVEREQHELARAQADYTVAHLSYTRLNEVIKTHPDLIALKGQDPYQDP